MNASLRVGGAAWYELQEPCAGGAPTRRAVLADGHKPFGQAKSGQGGVKNKNKTQENAKKEIRNEMKARALPALGYFNLYI